MSVAWVGAGIAAVGAVSGMVNGKKAANAAQTSADASAAATNQQAAIAQDQWDTYKDTYQPLEKQYVADSQNYDTPAQYEKAAGDASATVSEQFGKARDRLSRTPGLDPSSGAATAAMAGLDMGQAATDAVSQNAARTNVQNTAWARKTDALSLGKGLAATASSSLGSVANSSLAQANSLNSQANAYGNSVGLSIDKGLGYAKTLYNSPGLSTTPNPTTSSNVNSGGNDGWTLSNGESLGT